MSYRLRMLAVALAVLVLGGCQDDQRHGGVAAEQAKSVRRIDHLQSVASNGKALVAVGSFGAVIVSGDDGASWKRRDLAEGGALIKATTCGDGSFAVLDFGGRLWLGTPDGATWAPRDLPPSDAHLDVACAPDNRLWVTGARGLLVTSGDSGKSWTSKSLDEDIQLLNVQFPTPAFGVVTGEFGRVLITTDGGATWAPGGGLGEDFYPQGMHFQNERRGLVVGLSGAVIETLDGGRTWVRGNAPVEAPLYGVLALPGDEAVVAGAGGIAARRAGGAWTPIPGVPMADLRGLAVTGTGLVLAGTGTLMPIPATKSN